MTSQKGNDLSMPNDPDVTPAADPSTAVVSREWLAGLLEGEGYFGRSRTDYKDRSYFTPNIQLSMADRDIVDRVAVLWKKSVYTYNDKRPQANKPIYTVTQAGIPALVTMLEVFPHMGNRRRQRIADVLSAWEHNPRKLGRPNKEILYA